MEIQILSVNLIAKILITLGLNLLLLQNNAIGAEKINLPPMPKDDNSLMGVDANKNEVRDDIEIFIYNHITKDPEVFRAYLNYARSQSLFIAGYPNEKTLEQAKKKMDDATDCLFFYDRNTAHQIRSISMIINLLYNTPKRKTVDAWYAKKSFGRNMSYEVRNNIKKEDVCDFLQ